MRITELYRNMDVLSKVIGKYYLNPHCHLIKKKHDLKSLMDRENKYGDGLNAYELLNDNEKEYKGASKQQMRAIIDNGRLRRLVL